MYKNHSLSGKNNHLKDVNVNCKKNKNDIIRNL